MKKSSKWGRRLYARIGAVIISAAFITSSVSEIIPGGVAYAEDEFTFENDKFLQTGYMMDHHIGIRIF